jgi:hypothetical protein
MVQEPILSRSGKRSHPNIEDAGGPRRCVAHSDRNVPQWDADPNKKREAQAASRSLLTALVNFHAAFKMNLRRGFRPGDYGDYNDPLGGFL